MSFTISCPRCMRTLNVTEKAFGKTVPCPACNQPINVPKPAGAPSVFSSAPVAPNVNVAINTQPTASIHLPAGMPPVPNSNPPPQPSNDPLGFLPSEPGARTLPADRAPPGADGFAALDSAPPPGQLPAGMPSLPDLEAPRKSSFPSAFPKGTPSSFIDFLDFGFKRYLTPWIVRHVWLWAVCLLGLGLMVQVAVYVHKSLPTQEVVSLAIPPEAKMRKGFLDDLIRNKETPKVTEIPKGESPPGNIPAARGVDREREPDWREEYSKMALRQLKAERKSLDEKFPETGTRWTLWSTFYLVSAGAAVLGTTLSLVILRVVCELIIVIFSIAAALTTISDNTAVSRKSSRD